MAILEGAKPSPPVDRVRFPSHDPLGFARRAGAEERGRFRVTFDIDHPYPADGQGLFPASIPQGDAAEQLEPVALIGHGGI